MKGYIHERDSLSILADSGCIEVSPNNKVWEWICKQLRTAYFITLGN